MFTDLAVIDWIALIFAAVLLAAAAAAAIIAFLTSSSRPKTAAGADERPAHATGARSGRATTPSRPHAATIDLTKPQPRATQQERGSRSAVKRHALDRDAEVAARAAKLRRAPVAETRGPELRSGGAAVVLKRTPAHAKTMVPESRNTASTFASSHYDTVDGFKARDPGFFDDPMGRHELRYWDGHTWTEYVKERGERFTDPL